MIRRALLALTLLAATAHAHEPPVDLDELLERVQAGRTRDTEIHAQRMAQFRAERDRQSARLDSVRTALRAARARSAELEQAFDRNETALAQRSETLQDRLGSLNELFGVLQQVTGDTRARVASSVISAQVPDRDPPLAALSRKLDSTTTLPSVDDIETLWGTLVQQMVMGGEIARFDADVTAPDGTMAPRPVVRLGTFGLIADGAYLDYTPGTGRISEYGRQPQGRFVETTSAALTTTESMVTVGIDPTRGQLLSSYLDRPGVAERVGQGGPVGMVIIVLGLVGLFLALERLVRLAAVDRRVERQLGSDDVARGQPARTGADRRRQPPRPGGRRPRTQAQRGDLPRVAGADPIAHLHSHHRGCRSAAGPSGHRDGHDHDVPVDHALRYRRPPAHGRRHLASPGDDGARPAGGGAHRALARNRVGAEQEDPPRASGAERGRGGRARRTGGHGMTLFHDLSVAVRDFLELGGPVLAVIVGAILIMWVLIFERVLFFWLTLPRMRREFLDGWAARAERGSWQAKRIREALISRVDVATTGPTPVIHSLVALCPLLGILGTVTGMIEVFDVLSLSGTGNARSMAAGVSRASIPTMAGMVGALTGVLAANALSRWSRRQVNRISGELVIEEGRHA